MKSRTKGRFSYFIGIAVILLAVLLIGGIYTILSQTSQANIYLGDTRDESNGWEYEVLSENAVQPVEPEYVDEYTQQFTAENISAVKITRTMTETINSAQIRFSTWGIGIEVFFDGSLLYTQFPEAKRVENGYLILGEQDFLPLQGDSSHDVALSLPSDYTGGKLTVITYFPPDYEMNPSPAFPTLGNTDMLAAPLVAATVVPVAILTVSAMFVLLLAIIFLLSTRNGKPDYKILLLLLFYLLLFLNRAWISLPGAYSGLTNQFDASLFDWFFATPLCIYIACKLTQWRKIALLCAAALQAVYDGVAGIINLANGLVLDVNRTGIAVLIMLLLSIVLVCMEYAHNPDKMRRYVNAKYVASAVAILLLVSFSESMENGTLPGYYTDVFTSLWNGNFKPLVTLLSATLAVMMTLLLVVEFIRNTIETKNRADLLQARSEMAMESYRMMRTASEHTYAAQHELRHHVMALQGMLEQNEAQKALQYMSAISGTIDALPSARYSDNLLVNTTAGVYLEHAKREGISVRHSLILPESLRIEDCDLCVYLTNLMENAMEACMRQPAQQNRFIYLLMHYDGGFLLISCKNSTDGKKEADINGNIITSKKDKTRHGYGLLAMRLIAEKYGSALKIDSAENEFEVKTNLRLRSDNA